MSRAKRYSLQLSEETMALFKQIHKERKAKNIGLSIKETILSLRKELEEKSEAPLVHPFTGAPLSKDESAYIQRIQKEKGFQTVREAFSYFEGGLEQRIEKRLGTKALEQTLDEASKDAPTTETSLTIDPALSRGRGKQCPHYSFNHKMRLVECKRKLAETNTILRTTEQVCDKCWDYQSKKQQAQENPSEKSEAS